MRLPLSTTTSTTTRPTDHIGEVIEASTTSFLGQCFQPDDLTFPAIPALGSWVRSRDEETGNILYGVVTHATISPVDSVHRARALGLTAQELREQQPQIFAMLKTDFQVALVGFDSGDRLYQYLPPRPPQIHQAVYRCSPEQIRRFCQQIDFLHTLLQVTGVPVDELVAAVIRQCYHLLHYDRAWLVQVGRQLSLLLREDYDRLSAIIRKIQP